MTQPARLTVPTCVGCGAMGEWGTCETGCTEQKLELVRASASDTLSAVAARASAQSDAFSAVARELLEEATLERYGSLQARARAALVRYPDTDHEDEWAQPSEPAITWWCERCGGIEAPQPCLGICVWRPVDWVNRGVYERTREQAFAARRCEKRLRHLLRRIAAVTPRPEQLDDNWRVFAAEARSALAE
jgi:hypothetical protein